MFAIRGAVRIERNDRESILAGARRLLEQIVEQNRLSPERIVAAHFTMTPDLDAAFPAYAARELGWNGVPMLGAQETAVPDAPDRMLRVLLLVEGKEEARHVYLGEAAALRPDLAGGVDVDEGPETGTAQQARVHPRAAAARADLGTLLVVGLGLIGGSAALALAASGRFERILGVDVSEKAVRAAEDLGAVDRGATDPTVFLPEADVVLLAIPVDLIPSWIDRWGGALEPGTVVLDVGSTKREVVDAMGGLPGGVEAVGGHPLAGKEHGGIEHAEATLFREAPWALVETPRTGDRGRELAEVVVWTAGARPVWLNAAEHDRRVAITSHLPFLVSKALATEARGDGPPDAEEADRRLRGPGFRDMTRLAATDPRMMAGILATNWTEVRGALERFEARLSELVRRLDGVAGDAESSAPNRASALERSLEV